MWFYSVGKERSVVDEVSQSPVGFRFVAVRRGRCLAAPLGGSFLQGKDINDRGIKDEM